MNTYRLTLTTLDVTPAYSTTLKVTAPTKRKAIDQVLSPSTDLDALKWSNAAGNVVSWEETGSSAINAKLSGPLCEEDRE